ncbi:MAG: molybdopterin-guanine dinucleotide biosynthesis protein B [Desulfobacterales bacterium]|jgi:molybdopterin-guanine dinucleotide biosynthesis adapter protein|nr:molybdopterin-guanine dinucleotide biosynthesis protein B [Desulfobacterales bacterium]
MEALESHTPPIVSIVGRSNSGKTTLIEKLIPVLRQRGYRIGTIKHTHHPIEVDRTGKDSARHRSAGAATVILASPGHIAMFKTTASESLDPLIRYFDDVDLLITEGYKREFMPKIEVLRAAVGTELLCRDDPQLVAVAADAALQVHVPVFRLNDPDSIADLIEQLFLNDRR